MINFPLHTIENAPEASRPTLEAMQEKMGMVPNLMGVLAESPEALKAYGALNGLAQESALSPAERQVVMLTVSATNACDYCMSAHSAFAVKEGLSEQALTAIRSFQAIEDSKLEALRVFTHQLMMQHGWLEEAEVQTFLDAGYEKRTVFDVILILALKTISNYTSHIVQPELDEGFKATKWEKPHACGCGTGCGCKD